MKALVLGCNGMAGHMISCYLQEKGHDVTGYARKKSDYVKTIVGDATDWEQLRSTIAGPNYDAVINCVGILNRAAEEHKSEAILLNSYLPHFIADTVKPLPTKVIHISTDCVFSGTRGVLRR